jgi:hypothetical protein
MAGSSGREQEKPPAIERMARIDNLDLLTIFFAWVIEWGIQLCSRSTTLTSQPS